jgi:serine/threonine protein kinase
MLLSRGQTLGGSASSSVRRMKGQRRLALPGGVMGDDGPGVDGFLVGFSVGSRIAGYRLEEQIGEGGMAVVFRARDERLQRQVALKILSPALAADEEFRRRFIRESRSAAAVDDPHIIPVFEPAFRIIRSV